MQTHLYWNRKACSTLQSISSIVCVRAHVCTKREQCIKYMCVDTSLCIGMLLFLCIVTANLLIINFLATALEERENLFDLNSDNPTQTCFILAVSMVFQNFITTPPFTPIEAASCCQKTKRNIFTIKKKRKKEKRCPCDLLLLAWAEKKLLKEKGKLWTLVNWLNSTL